MKKDFIKAISKRYVFLFLLLALLFVFILLKSNVSARLFANIIATLVLLALIPFAIILLIRRKAAKAKK